MQVASLWVDPNDLRFDVGIPSQNALFGWDNITNGFKTASCKIEMI